MDANPNANGAHPKAMDANPNANGTHPKVMDTNPNANGAHPWEMDAYPIMTATLLNETVIRLNVTNAWNPFIFGLVNPST